MNITGVPQISSVFASQKQFTLVEILQILNKFAYKHQISYPLAHSTYIWPG